MTHQTNATRATAALMGLQTYVKAKGETPFNSLEEHIIDMLTDTMHMAAIQKIDFKAAVDMAADHFNHEKGE